MAADAQAADPHRVRKREPTARPRIGERTQANSRAVVDAAIDPGEQHAMKIHRRRERQRVHGELKRLVIVAAREQVPTRFAGIRVAVDGGVWLAQTDLHVLGRAIVVDTP
ncbi:hypothetical protein [Gaiella sp.]|uniref:hypothetical protein n=1 Tax=Gaiella sp. TaxID=2663207 RepID=UPI00398371BB